MRRQQRHTARLSAVRRVSSVRSGGGGRHSDGGHGGHSDGARRSDGGHGRHTASHTSMSHAELDGDVDDRRRGGSDGAMHSAGPWPRQPTVTWRTPSTSPLRGSSPLRSQARGRSGAGYGGGGSGVATPMAHSATPRLAASCGSLSGQLSGSSSPRFNLEDARALALLHAR